MSKLRVNCFGVSLDGYGAGVEQSIQNPMGIGGMKLHSWFLPTRTFRSMLGLPDGATGPDDDIAASGMQGLGAWILGRNMFGPVRGPWPGSGPDAGWEGWWGDEPPYACPVFILTHHPRAPIQKANGTVFHFVTGGMHEALQKAKIAANGKDIRVGGGVRTVRQYLTAGLIDEMHIAIVPEVLGKGEHLMQGLDLPALGYEIGERCATAHATHVVFRRTTR